MEQYTHIAFLYVMPSLMLLTWVAAIVWRFLRSKKQKTSIEQSFWLSLSVSIILIGIILYLWSTDGLTTALDSYKTIHELTIHVKNMFPILATLLLTFFGVFISFVLLRPRIKVGEYMAYANETSQLVVSVHNASWFAANNVSAKLYACSDDSDDLLVEDLTIEDGDNHILDWWIANNNTNAIEFNTKKKDERVKNVLKDIKDNKKFLELRVTATHAVSGTTSTFTQRYTSENILYGLYDKNQFMVIEEDQSRRPYKKWKTRLSSLYNAFVCLECISIFALFSILYMVINNTAIAETYFAIFFGVSFGVFLIEIGRWWLNMPYKGKVETEYVVVNYLQ